MIAKARKIPGNAIKMSMKRMMSWSAHRPT